ncbi:MAG: hypothetical protein V1685_06460 [Parcubacteria group bacterium]
MDNQPSQPVKKISTSAMMWIIFVVILVFAGFGIYLWWQNGVTNTNKSTAVNAVNTPNRNVNTVLNTEDGITANANTISYSGLTRRFSNTRIGISFRYPEEWGEVELSFKPGDEGNMYIGNFQNYPGFEFGGVDSKFTLGGDGTFLSTAGFVQDSGKYYFKLAGREDPRSDPHNLFELEVLNKVSANSSEVIIINDQGFINQRWSDSPSLNLPAGQYGSVMNLFNSEFAGIAFIDKDVSNFSLDAFKELLSTITIL